jgi:hypothetical protein
MELERKLAVLADAAPRAKPIYTRNRVFLIAPLAAESLQKNTIRIIRRLATPVTI